MTPPPGSHWLHRKSGRIAMVRWTDEVDGVGYSYDTTRVNRISLADFCRRFRRVPDGFMVARPVLR